ncbi:hypothetical protein RB595_008424 [Gaeumannomyces hyphopodioides]
MADTLAEGDRGNSATLTKVDRLRELIGNKISLPQLVVVGDQSSGKSSVLEGITGFAFPRDAELCTRYATQITCRREDYESATVTIIPHEDADPDLATKLKSFSRVLPEAAQMNNKMLGDIFKDVNKELGIMPSPGLSPRRGASAKSSARNAFSEHLLKIEICSPQQEHFTVIDVPGIFRKETQGVTTEADINLVKNLVMRYMRDSRTIILAVVPANVDPATQEILKLAKQVDPGMKRTMGVLTKPDLAIEKTMQQIAIDHVTGKRSDLTLGYYIVKNRGSDQVDMTLQAGQDAETAFFAKKAWSAVRKVNRAGIKALKTQVRNLLTDLVKHEFRQLRVEVEGHLAELRDEELALGPHRSDRNAQRAYLGNICDQFQAITRDALSANYASHSKFFVQGHRRLITRIVELNEQFSAAIQNQGHTRAFSQDEDDTEPATEGSSQPNQAVAGTGQASHVSFWTPISPMKRSAPVDGKDGDQPVARSTKRAKRSSLGFNLDMPVAPVSELFPIVSEIMAQAEGPHGKALLKKFSCIEYLTDNGDNIMDYIKGVYTNSRGADLGTFNGSLLAAVFLEQTKNWESITEAYILLAECLVTLFIKQVILSVCSDKRVGEELYDNLLSDPLRRCFARAHAHAESLLDIERKNPSFTLNHYFNDNLSKTQGARLTAVIKRVAGVPNNISTSAFDEPPLYTLTRGQLENIAIQNNQSNSEHMQEYIHDLLKSYYKVSMKRFVDIMCLHVIHHDMLFSADGPLHIFTSKLIHALDDDQLDQFAGEDQIVKVKREKLVREIQSFRAALEVLQGTSRDWQ